MKSLRKVNVEGLGRLPAFCHAVVAGDLIFVSGTLGTKPGGFELVPGGMGPETRQTLENVRSVLGGVGATFDDVVKMSVFITDMGEFAKMNEAYLEFFGANPPARITVGCSALALGAKVEIDCIARNPKT
jgi:reactive intermediate/imine deaminase